MLLAKKLRLIAGSVEMAVIHLGSYVPSNATRIALLRACGATIGRGVAIGHGCQVRVAHRLTIGDGCFIAEDVILDARGGLEIGSNVSINSRAQIWTAQHDWQDDDFAYTSAPVRIENRCWISAGVIVLPGTTIGEGAVVAAGAVASKNIAPFKLVGGIPAKPIAERPRTLRYETRGNKSKMWWW